MSSNNTFTNHTFIQSNTVGQKALSKRSLSTCHTASKKNSINNLAKPFKISNLRLNMNFQSTMKRHSRQVIGSTRKIIFNRTKSSFDHHSHCIPRIQSQKPKKLISLKRLSSLFQESECTSDKEFWELGGSYLPLKTEGENNGMFYPENDFMSSDSESEEEYFQELSANGLRQKAYRSKKVGSQTDLERKLDRIFGNSKNKLPHSARKSEQNKNNFSKENSQKPVGIANKFKIKSCSKASEKSKPKRQRKIVISSNKKINVDEFLQKNKFLPKHKNISKKYSKFAFLSC